MQMYNIMHFTNGNKSAVALRIAVKSQQTAVIYNSAARG
jgi:hypothetical protein